MSGGKAAKIEYFTESFSLPSLSPFASGGVDPSCPSRFLMMSKSFCFETPQHLATYSRWGCALMIGIFLQLICRI